MMFAKPYALILPAALALSCSACCSKHESCKHDDYKSANQLYLDKMDETLERGMPHLQDMVDNAILHDMTVADIHFVPHTAEISGTGAARLDRMAPLLDTYGGTVRYETYATDDDLTAKRLEHVREYLAVAGCNMERVKVETMISGGRTTPAKESMEIMHRGTAKPANAPPPASFTGSP